MRTLRLGFLLLTLSPCAFAQQNGAPLPAPAPPMAPLPRPEDHAVTQKESESINAQLTEARQDTAGKRYAESEALMLRITHDHPNLILPWVELGLAQMGLRKYPDAETSFKMALGIDPTSLRQQHSQDFYQPVDAPGAVAPAATRASRNTAGGGVSTNAEARTPEIRGTAYASLGEAYAHQGKIADAQAAFNTAVNAAPAHAAQYRRNETISFFQAGNPDAQLEAANQAIALDPSVPDLYYFKAQSMVAKATVDPATQKMVLPAGCAEAYQRYLELAPGGPYSADARGVLAAAGIPVKAAH